MEAKLVESQSLPSHPSSFAPPPHQGSQQPRPRLVQDVRVLILTAPIGAGHISTARALGRDLKREGASVDIAAPLLDATGLAVLPALYKFTTIHLKSLWAAYYYGRNLPLLSKTNSIFFRTRLRKTFEGIDFNQYDAIVLTYGMYCHLMPDLAGTNVRVVVVATDLYGGPREWFQPGADRYVMPTTAMHDLALRHNLPAGTVTLRRLPTYIEGSQRMADWSADDRTDLRILIIGGSGGVGPLEPAAYGVLRAYPRASVTVVCGTNSALARRLRKQKALNVHGFVPNISQQFRNYDVVMTKPGSVTLMELLDQKVPFLLLPGIPGIEAANATMLSHCVESVRCRKSARHVIDRLIDHDLSLTVEGHRWIDAVAEAANNLPKRRLTLDDIVPCAA